MITFKQGQSEAPDSFQVNINRKAIGFWIKADTAAEAEQKFVEFASEGSKLQPDVEAYENLRDQIEDQKDLIGDLRAQLADRDEQIRRMKTTAPEPKKVKRFFGRKVVETEWPGR